MLRLIESKLGFWSMFKDRDFICEFSARPDHIVSDVVYISVVEWQCHSYNPRDYINALVYAGKAQYL